MFVLKKIGGWYVADMSKSRGGSYTNKLQLAKIYYTKEEADRDRCPENEVIVPVDKIIG